MTEENICPSCHRPLPPDAPGGLCPACVLMGAREDAPPPGLPDLDQLRAAFPQFEILECIGRGGMGAVYKARQPQLDRIVALKILLPGLERDPGFAERFAREARALAKLNHPNIVAVHDFGESDGLFWLTMEFVDGVNLRQAMQAARFTPAQALAIIPELCSALQYAHDHGILHRDIKPENILLDARGKVKVADFGIARMAGDERLNPTLTMTGAALGTTAYIAPEQIENPRAVDHRADLYSLGVVLYEMLTGELPLGRFPAPSERSASDPRLDEVVFRSLEKQPEKRYQQAEEFSNKVAGAASPSPVPAVLATLGPKRGKTSVFAVAAAACTGFSMLLGVPVLGALLHELPRRGSAGLGGREMQVLFVVSVLPALCGMVLGAVSWVQIRDAEGTLRGLRLARFAVLAWPVMFVLSLLHLKFSILGLAAAGLGYGLYRLAKVLWRSPSDPPPPPAPLPQMSSPAVVTPRSWLLPWTFGLLIAGGTLIGIACIPQSLLIGAPGACAVVLGFAGGWWALWEMKKGRMLLGGRNPLLLFIVWLPLLAAAAVCPILIADEPPPAMAVKGGYIGKVILLFIATFVVAAPVLSLVALPRDRRLRTSPRRRLFAGISLLLVLASLVAAKRYDGHWPAANYLAGISITMPEGFPWKGTTGPALEQTAGAAVPPIPLSRYGSNPTPPVFLKDTVASNESPFPKAFRVAAGDYADRMAISYDVSPPGNYVQNPTIFFMTHNKKEAEALWNSFRQRLLIALPRETTLKMSHWPAIERIAISTARVYSQEHFVISSCIMLTAALAAVLAAWCLFPLASLPLAAGVLAAIAAILSPVWPDTEFNRMLIEGPPLAPFEKRVEAPDFSDPAKAARTVFDAAWAGDLELMKRGISKRLRGLIDERGTGAWDEVRERLDGRWAVSRAVDNLQFPNQKQIRYTAARSGGSLKVLLEDGEWRLDDLPFSLEFLGE